MTDQKPIQHYLNDSELLQLCIEQIQKDFQEAEIQIDKPEQMAMAYSDLHAQIKNAVTALEKRSNSRLMQLLYRIDISENQIKHSARQFPEENFESRIAHLIIRRELQKVIIRKTYSKQKKDDTQEH